MIVGIKYIQQWFADLGVPYWAVYYKSKVEAGNPVFRSNPQDAVSPSDALSELERKLPLLDRGQYTIMAGEKPKVSERGSYRVDFDIVHDNAPQGTTTQISGLPTTLAEVKDMVKTESSRMIEEYKKERELEEMRKKVKELEKDCREYEQAQRSGMGRLMTAISGIGVDKILAAFGAPKIPAVAGIGSIPDPPENDANYAGRLGRVIEIFSAADPDWLVTLERMADKVQADPKILEQLKIFL